MLGLGLGLTSEGALRRAAGGTWTPLALGASLKDWWNADDHGTANMVDDGAGLISSWKGRIAATNPTATTTARPTWAATSFNSAYAGVTGNTTSTSLRTTTFPALPTLTTDGEIWLVVNNPSIVPAYMIMYGAVASACRALGYQSTPRLQSADGVSTTYTMTAPVFSGNFIVGASWSGTTAACRINGAAATPASAVITTINTPSSGAFTLFSYNNGTTLWSAVTIRHAFVTLILSATEREKLEGWCAWDSGLTSGLPGGHPYKLVRP